MKKVLDKGEMAWYIKRANRLAERTVPCKLNNAKTNKHLDNKWIV